MGPVYYSFCKKEFLTATFVDVKGSLDSVHISTLISVLVSLNIPYALCNFISLLFSQGLLMYSTPSGVISKRLTYRGLPQGNWS